MTEPTHADILRRIDVIDSQLKAGAKRFAAQDRVLKSIDASLACLPKLQSDMAQIRPVIEGLAAARTMGKFLKWAAGVVVAITAIAVAIKTGAAHVFK